ncbi:TPA_asm: P [Morus betacytorhabdovirus 1]|nr:TPA_asm: P [Morus betacytorhabdovirus 1]
MLAINAIGKPKKQDLSKLFLNNTAPLFLTKDPHKIPDDQLPIVPHYSGLSRNKRKKNKNWATDPDLTRKRMASAQEVLAKELKNLDILDRTSYLDSMIEDLPNCQFDKSQTEFVIPKPGDPDHYATDKAEMVGKALTMKALSDYASKLNLKTDHEHEEEYEVDDEEGEKEMDDAFEENQTACEKKLTEAEYTKAISDVAHDLSDAPSSVRSAPIDNRSEDRGRTSILNKFPGQKGMKSWRPRAHREISRGREEHREFRPNTSSRKKHWKMEGSQDVKPERRVNDTYHGREERDFDEFKRSCSAIFDDNNVNIHGEHEDNMVFLYHKYEGKIDDPMIEMYIAGIKKERQTSLSKRHENIVHQLASTATALGKQLEIMKENNKVQQYLNETMLRSRGDSESDAGSASSQVVEHHVSKFTVPKIESDRVYHPLPLVSAPKSQPKSAAEKVEKSPLKQSFPTEKQTPSKETQIKDKGKDKEGPVKTKAEIRAEAAQAALSGAKKPLVIEEPSEYQIAMPPRRSAEYIIQESSAREQGLAVARENIKVHRTKDELKELSDDEIILLALNHISAPQSMMVPEYLEVFGYLMERYQWIDLIRSEDPKEKASSLDTLTNIIIGMN